ncbi:MAG: rhomboid family intramembrane serine protease [bacterium]|nr:rhomboid family intramembrane serine protease [bacterium]
MRLLGTLEDKSQAATYAAYMVTQGVSTIIEEDGDKYLIWIKDEDHVQEASEELKLYLADPSAEKYQGILARAQEVERKEQRRIAEMQKNVVDMRGRWGKNGGVPLKRTLTLVLIGICIVIALLSNFGDFQNNPAYTNLLFRARPDSGVEMVTNELWQSPSYHLDSIRHGEVWRLISPIFLHFSLQHLLFNMYALFVFGGKTENEIGTWKYALLIVAIAFASNFCEALAPTLLPSEWGGGSNFGGMSGVVYGLFGFVWMKWRFDPTSKLVISPISIFIFMGWLIYAMFSTDPIANYAHVFGLIMGVVIGYVSAIRNAAAKS